jgi:3-phenylpropionate/trans-cinnamate dioxygenase ferredoxin reductase component
MSHPIAIIGAGMAGHRAAISLRASGYDGAITLIGEEPHLPYDRPPLSKSAITDVDAPKPNWLLDEGIAASLKLDTHLGTHAEHIDRAGQTIRTSKGKFAYSKLLLATGAKPRKLNCPGGEHAFLLRNFEDAVLLRDRFQPGTNIVIIGGGFIGLELASSASKRGCNVTVIEAQPRILMRGVPPEIADIVRARHVAAGVHLRTGTALKSIEATAVILSDDSKITADTIIAGIGAAPETKLAADAGLAIDNGIAVNQYLQTNDPLIYAAGDCCSFPHPAYNMHRLRLEAWRNAQDQGSVAGENMAGGTKVYAAIPWFWSDQFDLSLQIAGLASEGPTTIARQSSPENLLLFHLAQNGKLMGASAIGTGNSIARDVKLAEMLIAKGAAPSPALLADPSVQLKSILKG